MSWTALEYVLPDEPFTGVERPILDGFLDRYRASFLNRCSGLTAGQLAERSVPPSNLSLIGIARHLTDVELSYVRRRWGGKEPASYHVSQDRPDALSRIQPGRIRRELDHRQPVRMRPVNFRITALTRVFRLSQQTIIGTCNWWCPAAISPA